MQCYKDRWVTQESQLSFQPDEKADLETRNPTGALGAAPPHLTSCLWVGNPHPPTRQGSGISVWSSSPGFRRCFPENEEFSSNIQSKLAVSLAPWMILQYAAHTLSLLDRRKGRHNIPLALGNANFFPPPFFFAFFVIL